MPITYRDHVPPVARSTRTDLTSLVIGNIAGPMLKFHVYTVTSCLQERMR